MDKPVIHRLKVHGSWHSFVEPMQRREAFTTSGTFSGGPVSGYGLLERGWLPLGWWNSLTEEPDLDYVVWSFRTPIAWHSRNGWTMPDVKYSQRTSVHQGKMRTVIEYLKNQSSSIGS